MVDCMECTNFIECHYSGQLTGRLTSCPDFKQKPMTNAQKIRAMTDEELAKECVKRFPMYLWPTDVRTIYFDFDNHNKNNVINAWIKWLQQPAKEETT